MRKLTYLAVFEPAGNGGYSVYFPDLLGCITFGTSFDDARKQAIDALGLHIYGMEKDGENIPDASIEVKIEEDTSAGYLVSPVSAFPDIVRNELDGKKLKTNTTLPAWVKEIAEKNNVNYSQLLENAIIDYLDIPRPRN